MLFSQLPIRSAINHLSVGYFSINQLIFSVSEIPELLPIAISQRCHLEIDCFVHIEKKEK